MNNLYTYIFYNSEYMSNRSLRVLLFENELNILSKFLKHKFNDSRTIKEIKQIIREEYPPADKL